MGNAERQARWRAKRNALARDNPEVVEGELLQQAERCERLSGEERLQLADRLADAAMVHLRRSQELARVAMKVRAGERP
jgi:hypothetical protein